MPTPAQRGQLVGFPDEYFDAFNRLRVSAPVSLFDTSFQYDIPTMAWQTKTVSGGTVAHSGSATSSTAQALMTLPTTTGAAAYLQTRQYFRYQAGKSHLVKVTAIPGAGVANVRKRIGYFDDLNGVFWEQNGSTDAAFVVRTNTGGSASDASRVAAANWNIDKMDGTGASGVTLDYSKGQIIIIDLQWLGLGRVRVGFEVDGRLYYCHEFKHSNILTVPYMRTAHLPIRYEMVNTSTSAGTTMVPVCAAIDSEGGYSEDIGYPFSVFNTADITQNGATDVHLLSIRLKGTFNGSMNRSLISLSDFGMIIGNVSTIATVLWNTTVTGGAWVSADANSVVEYNITNTITGGVPIKNLMIGASSGNGNRFSGEGSIAQRVPLALDVDGGATTSTVVSLVARATGASTQVMRGMISWKELR